MLTNEHQFTAAFQVNTQVLAVRRSESILSTVTGQRYNEPVLGHVAGLGDPRPNVFQTRYCTLRLPSGILKQPS
jgi:hypothetical protein